MTPTQKKSSPTVANLHKSKTKLADWMHAFQWPDAIQTHIPIFAKGKLPRVDIIDDDKDLLIRAELPGVDKKDLDISMTENSLMIKARTRHEEKEEKINYFRSEIVQGQYARTIELPVDIDIERTKTSFKNGILELTAPKLGSSIRRNSIIK